MESASIAASSSFVTFFMRMRLEWNVNRSGDTASRERSSAGISVSIVVFELGTICPMRYVRAILFRCLIYHEPRRRGGAEARRRGVVELVLGGLTRSRGERGGYCPCCHPEGAA